MRLSPLCLLFVMLLKTAAAQTAPPLPGPDERYKADILVVVAHPDDETEITGYLARAIYEEHKRVAVVFGTPGNGGGDAVSLAQAASLADERQIEARKALATFGVMNVWFLGGTDTPGQDVLRSLETWNHGAVLWNTVRIMRLTRPEVVMTWMPEYVAGENHGDHQAAGVIATEAFDSAGDPTVFPEQVAAPRDRFNIGNLTEGLQPWQPKKLYFFSDASNQDFMKGKGPEYSTLDQSPSQGKPYYLLAAEEMSKHLTQGDTGQMAAQALRTGDFTYFKTPVRMVLGKSLVGGAVTGDAFEGVKPGAIAFERDPGYEPQRREGSYIELGGPFAFYNAFQQTHGLRSLIGLLPPEVQIGATEMMHVPVLIHSADNHVVSVDVTLPKEWRQTFHSYAHFDKFPVKAGETYPVWIDLQSAGQPQPDWQKVTITAKADGKDVGAITVLVNLNKDFGLPQ